MKCAWKELLAILPPWIRTEVDRHCNTLQEVRLRRNKPVVLVCQKEKIELLRQAALEDLQYVINSACRYSPWTAATTAQGFVTAPGGHRIGLCGEAVVRNGAMNGIGTVSSLNIRVARDFPGISGNLWLRKENILILGPPGSGKTTLLRDLIRQRAQQENVAVVDERGEIFPIAADFPTGLNTDVVNGCSKPQGIELVLRAMSPDCIAVDEITAGEDCSAMVQAGWCGVSLVATAHASSAADLRSRVFYAPLVASGLFNTAVVLRKDKSWYTERIT